MIHMLAQALVGPGFFLHAMLVGAALLPLILEKGIYRDKSQHDRLLLWFWSACLGSLANTLVLVLLGLLGLFALVPITLCLTLLALTAILRHLKQIRHSGLTSGEDRQIAGWLLFWCFPLVLVSLNAHGYWDDTMYHLPLARSYLTHEAIVLEPYLRFPLFPQHMNILFGVGLLYGGEIGAQSIATIPLALISLGLMGISRLVSGSVVTGVVASFAIFWTRPVAEVLGYAYVDIGLALYCTAAASVLAWLAGQTYTPLRWQGLMLLGLFVGAAAGVKLFGLLFAGIIGVVVFAYFRNTQASIAFVVAALVAGSIWYIRSMLISGDPVHPAGGAIFGYYLWDAQDLISQKQEQATHGVPVASLNILWALVNAGAWLLAPALVTLLFPRLPAALRLLRIVFVSYLVSWFLVSQVNRYLIPVLPIGLLLSAWVIGQLGSLCRRTVFSRREWLKINSTSMLTGTACAGMAFVMIQLTPNMVLTEHTRQSLLAKRPGYNLIAKANELIPTQGSRLLQIGFDNGFYFFHGTVIGDWFGPGRYRQFGSCENDVCKIVSGREMARLMRTFQTNMLVVATRQMRLTLPPDYFVYFEQNYSDPSGVLLVLRST